MKKNRIHNIFKTVIASAILLSLVLSMPSYTVANADTLSDLKNRYNAYQNQQQQIQNKINDLNSKVSTAKEKRDAINDSVKVLNNEISLLDAQIDTLNVQIKTTNEDIAKTEENINKENERYKERICTIYEVGSCSKLEVLLSSKDISDFLVKYDTIKAVSDYDKKLMEDLKNDRDKLQNQKDSLDSQLATLEDSKGTLAAKKSLKKAQLAEAKKVVDGLQADKEEKVSEEKALNQKRLHTDAEIEKEIARIAEKRNKELKAQGSPPVSNNDIVKAAREYLGVRYQLGAASKTAIDCSGLVDLALASTLGRKFPHSAAKLSTLGSPVSRENLQPGDVVFFKIHNPYVDHCGIYTGNGYFIAANSGSRKCVYEDELFNSHYWSRYYVGARRIR